MDLPALYLFHVYSPLSLDARCPLTFLHYSDSIFSLVGKYHTLFTSVSQKKSSPRAARGGNFVPIFSFLILPSMRARICTEVSKEYLALLYMWTCCCRGGREGGGPSGGTAVFTPLHSTSLCLFLVRLFKAQNYDWKGF